MEKKPASKKNPRPDKMEADDDDDDNKMEVDAGHVYEAKDNHHDNIYRDSDLIPVKQIISQILRLRFNFVFMFYSGRTVWNVI